MIWIVLVILAPLVVWSLRFAFSVEVERRLESSVERNERLIAQRAPAWTWGRPSPADLADLADHPRIRCAFSAPLGDGPTGSYRLHGIRPALWRADMSNPRCRACMVEDPYE